MPKTKTPNTHSPSTPTEAFHGDMRKGAYLRRQATYRSESAGKHSKPTRKHAR